MVSNVITYMHLDKLSEFGQFNEEVLVEVVELVLQLSIGDLAIWIPVAWIVVDVGDENCLREGGLGVLARTAVSVTAGSDLGERKRYMISWSAESSSAEGTFLVSTHLVVEGAVDLVLLSSVDAGEKGSHGEAGELLWVSRSSADGCLVCEKEEAGLLDEVG